MVGSLTPKQLAFACAYVELGNAAEAYRRSYDAKNMQAKTIHEAACRLLADSKVSARVEQLQADLVRQHSVTIGSLVAELDDAREIALSHEKPQPAAAVAATLGKARLLGMLTERIQANVTTRELPASIDDLV